ncbi:MAG TPA: metal ABC transporter permease [Chloroflexota bacterium]
MSLLDPLRYDFFVRGLLAATVVGGLCGLVGVFVILRHMSYIGHGLSHAVFGGAVVSYLLQVNFYLGAALWGFAAALLINATARRRGVGADAAIGIITTASFALGVALISRVRRFTQNFEAALFGNVLGVTPDDLVVISLVAVAVVALVVLAYRQLLFVTFDPEVAAIYGVPAGRIEVLLALALASTIIASMQVLGVTLVAAALIIPATVARLLSADFNRLVVLAAFLGALFGASGMYLSYFANISSGATIVLLASLGFAATVALQSLRKTVVVARTRAAERGATAKPLPRVRLDQPPSA